MGAVLSPDAKLLFVSNGRAKSVSVIDVAQRRLLRTMNDVGQRPWGIGINADGTKLLTARPATCRSSTSRPAPSSVDQPRRQSVGIAVASAP